MGWGVVVHGGGRVLRGQRSAYDCSSRERQHGIFAAGVGGWGRFPTHLRTQHRPPPRRPEATRRAGLGTREAHTLVGSPALPPHPQNAAGDWGPRQQRSTAQRSSASTDGVPSRLPMAAPGNGPTPHAASGARGARGPREPDPSFPKHQMRSMTPFRAANSGRKPTGGREPSC